MSISLAGIYPSWGKEWDRKWTKKKKILRKLDRGEDKESLALPYSPSQLCLSLFCKKNYYNNLLLCYQYHINIIFKSQILLFNC